MRTPFAILLREILGVLLLLAGLTVTGFAVWFLYQGYVIEGVAGAVLAVVVLLLGSHLVKVALAVRVVHDWNRLER